MLCLMVLVSLISLTAAEECPIGYKIGPGCLVECDDYKFGKNNCSGVCHCLDGKEVCNKKTGECTSGCQKYYVGTNCSVYIPGDIELHDISIDKASGTSVTVSWAVNDTIRHLGDVYFEHIQYIPYYALVNSDDWTKGQPAHHRPRFDRQIIEITGLEQNADYRIFVRSARIGWDTFDPETAKSSEIVKVTTTTRKNDYNTAIIVDVSVSVTVLVFFLVALVATLWYRRRRMNNAKTPSPPEISRENSVTMDPNMERIIIHMASRTDLHSIGTEPDPCKYLDEGYGDIDPPPEYTKLCHNPPEDQEESTELKIITY